MSRSSIKIAPGAVVCSECELRGDITIGQRTVIHPKARILAEAGPIIIGDGNLIEEVAVIHNRPDETNPNEKVMIIGSQNIFEVGSRCEAVKVGDFNVFEARSFVSRDTIISNGCTIGAMCSVTGREVLPDNCVVYGSACHRKVVSEKPPAQTLQLDFLAKILPNFHHIKKAGSSSAAAAKQRPA